MRTRILAVGAAMVASVGFAWASSGCVSPPPQAGFTLSDYVGTWFEIGKIQTVGGAIFEHDCVCTQLIVNASTTAPGDATVVNSCRKTTPSGPFINATSYLENPSQPPGRWINSFLPPPLPPVGVNYSIIFNGYDDASDAYYSVEYDCGDTIIGTNYCIHILSSKPTMAQPLLDHLLNASLSLGLNTESLPFNMTLQDGCW